MHTKTLTRSPHTVTLQKSIPSKNHFFKEPGSAITHLIGVILVAIGSIPILRSAFLSPDKLAPIAIGIFIGSMFLLYLASTLYHSIRTTPKITDALKKFDHIMIYFLIAGTYTPICLLALPRNPGIPLLSLIWGLTVCGIILTAFWVHSPKWLNSTIYIMMGWLCILAFKPLFLSITIHAFGWLLAGGIIYTIGGIIYALKLPIFNQLHPDFGSHEIFHLFVLGGSFCHYYMILNYIL